MERCLLALVFFSLFTSCGNLSSSGDVQDGFILTFPDSMLCVFNGGQPSVEKFNAPDCYQMLVYIDSTDCSNCEIVNSYILESFYYQMKEHSNFNFAVVYAPRAGQKESVCERLVNARLQYRAFIDDSLELEQKNTSLTNFKQLHRCMIKPSGEILIVGDPVSSDEVWMEYVSVIDSL